MPYDLGDYGICPNCLKHGKRNKLLFYWINLKKLLLACPDMMCPYPLTEDPTGKFMDGIHLLKLEGHCLSKDDDSTSEEEDSVTTPIQGDRKEINSIEVFNIEDIDFEAEDIEKSKEITAVVEALQSEINTEIENAELQGKQFSGITQETTCKQSTETLENIRRVHEEMPSESTAMGETIIEQHSKSSENIKTMHDQFQSESNIDFILDDLLKASECQLSYNSDHLHIDQASVKTGCEMEKCDLNVVETCDITENTVPSLIADIEKLGLEISNELSDENNVISRDSESQQNTCLKKNIKTYSKKKSFKPALYVDITNSLLQQSGFSRTNKYSEVCKQLSSMLEADLASFDGKNAEREKSKGDSKKELMVYSGDDCDYTHFTNSSKSLAEEAQTKTEKKLKEIKCRKISSKHKLIKLRSIEEDLVLKPEKNSLKQKSKMPPQKDKITKMTRVKKPMKEERSVDHKPIITDDDRKYEKFTFSCDLKQKRC